MRAATNKVAVFDSVLFDEHLENSTLPERPDRTKTIRNALVENLYCQIDFHDPHPIELDELYRTHSQTYVTHVKSQAEAAAGELLARPIKGNNEVLVTGKSFDIALKAAGAGVDAIKLIMNHKNDINTAFCNVRPPGHHASYSSGNGFCIFNNVIVAAEYALRNYKQSLRVAVLDWDVHHGDGTESYVYNHVFGDRLLFINTQQQHDTIWPGTGKSGTKGPKQNIISLNLQPGESDGEMKELFTNIVIPKLVEFKPDLILISCGFDAHEFEQIANLKLSSAMYGWMTTQLLSVCPRMISILEGGYSLQALAESIVYHVSALNGNPIEPPIVPIELPKANIVRVSQDHIYSNDELYNVNNLWVKRREPRPDDYLAVLTRAITRNWVNPDTYRILLSRTETTWLLKEAKIGAVTGCPSELFDDERDAAVAKYEHLFPPIPEGQPGWFIRTERVSLKEGVNKVGPYTNMRQILESLSTSREGHECINDTDDLDNFPIYFMPWKKIKQEYRVFVYQNRISAISTQHYSEIDRMLAEMTDDEIRTQIIAKLVDHFDNHNLRDFLAPIVGPDYTMDIAILEDDSVYFIEPNSFGAMYAAGSACFHWSYEHDELHREEHEPITFKFTDRE